MTRIGILGYGNLGKGVELAITKSADMRLVGVFTRRDPSQVKIVTSGVNVYKADELESQKDHIDVLIICGGSATDLPKQTPYYAKYFNVVDSFDTHANIPTHFALVNAAATEGKKSAVISAGWDPGMFSVNRLYASAILPDGSDCTFWGKGVSQGHSDAIRRIEGVLDAKQYTIPIDSAIETARTADASKLTARQKHTRECFVVAQDGADKEKIRQEIITMPNYFADYDTTVHFVSMDELRKNHSGIPHGGFVIRRGKTGVDNEHSHVIEYSLKLDSNPEFTASVLVACARAAHRFCHQKDFGAKTMFDIPPAYLSPKTEAELYRTML